MAPTPEPTPRTWRVRWSQTFHKAVRRTGILLKEYLKQMLQDLRTTIREDFTTITSNIHQEISELGDRTDHLEKKTEELCMAHNTVMDRLHTLEEDNAKLWHKLAHMEDTSRRNNLTFRGITESIPKEKIASYIIPCVQHWSLI
ncbi:Hypothetical predicted protein [Pelobates cultripes]|uniref:Uncharacterized protein n=1 Tax=Pelobates cultripes TaxID=61616 RepID=A0AAD1RDV8_PELCU|nr:Hypothetical predicted protein [Pelobates cultripes]